MNQRAPKPACPICSGTASHVFDVDSYAHFRCGDCNHLFVDPMPSPQTLEAFYSKGDYYHNALGQQHRIEAEAEQRMALLERLSTPLRLPKTILDVGCATGIFMSVAARHGWSVAGVEQSLPTAERARAIGLDVEVLPVEQLEHRKSPFGIVTAWEVIEHTTVPSVLLEALSRHIVPGGLLALSTPRSDGLPARVLGARFPMITPPEHLNLFSRKSLLRLAQARGFDLLHYGSFSNLSSKSVASGLSRMLGGQALDERPLVVRILINGVSKAIAWVPAIVDGLGVGSEMLVVFRKRAVQGLHQ